MITKEQFNEVLEILDVTACYGISDENAFELYEESNQDIEELTNKLEKAYE